MILFFRTRGTDMLLYWRTVVSYFASNLHKFKLQLAHTHTHTNTHSYSMDHVLAWFDTIISLSHIYNSTVVLFSWNIHLTHTHTHARARGPKPLPLFLALAARAVFHPAVLSVVLSICSLGNRPGCFSCEVRLYLLSETVCVGIQRHTHTHTHTHTARPWEQLAYLDSVEWTIV